ncbi:MULTISPECIES: tyramine oxidase subunit B [Corynebacterium]|uniref:Ornithine cyclodeaminase n=1 Tax=Corynebacterium freneyi TaxID=134034 RepID=A0ABS4U6D1_9CORY|nr:MULTISPECIES: tyramine oxidase subunit B [Corynebacterium]MBP2332190.1 ornithine cyclodeaminase [Corynebacterium freneyi]MCG7439833.1 tyramine oxidase subunit B [Corynebacterium freneyi]MDK8769112.1 tyramine oxidase subunit B [Corynebacterium freneyi]OFU58455.1 ornithine cyclodeaminase [Corynebacterium sp. HMSC11E11]QXA53594.1 ornithine cyclodeaminase [Corynebacterium freneyi]
MTASPYEGMPHIDFLYLSEPEMIEAGVTDSAACVETMEETLILLADGDYRMAGASANSHGAQINFPSNPEHEGMPADGPDRRFMAMPAYLGGRFRAAGVKWYGSNAENRNHELPRSIHVFVLNDATTGAPMAIMSANLLSAYRTGAVPGVGVKHLAVQNAETVGIIGPGVMSRTIFDSAISQRPGIKHLKIKGRSAGSTNRVAEYFREKYPQLESVTVVDSEREAIEGSDILIAGTSTSPDGPSGFPYFKREWIKPGALILCPAAARFDDDFITSDEANLVVDYTGLYEEWFNENGPDVTYERLLGIPGNRWWDMTEEGTLPKDKLVNIGDIAAGRAPGRTDDEQIFCYSIGGMPVEDVAWAYDVYENARAKGIGTTLNLWDMPVLR